MKKTAAAKRSPARKPSAPEPKEGAAKGAKQKPLAKSSAKPSAKSSAKSPAKSSKPLARSAVNPSAKPAPRKRAAAPARGRSNANPDAAREIYDRLARRYPDAHCALDHRNAFELLVATVLSAQCTDKRVNMVTPALFARWPDAAALSTAKPEELEDAIRSTGFFRSKAKSLLGMANALVDREGGEVPDDIEKLVQLPGVGRKTANVVLGNAFDRNEGVVVDTHVGRVSQRLALTRNDDPVKIEQDLMRLFPRERWTMLSHLMIEHGRQICDARKPRCEECPLADMCPASRV